VSVSTRQIDYERRNLEAREARLHKAEEKYRDILPSAKQLQDIG
jgi:hypothetical protein